MGDINEVWSATVRQSNGGHSEQHKAGYECYFEVLSDWVITGTSFRVHILVRVCNCDWYDDKSEMLNRKYIYRSEIGDGLELHVTENCTYMPKKIPDKIIKIPKYNSTKKKIEEEKHYIVQHDRYCKCPNQIFPVAQR